MTYLGPQLALAAGVIVLLFSGMSRDLAPIARRFMALAVIVLALARTAFSAAGPGDGTLVRLDGIGLAWLFVALLAALPFALVAKAEDEVPWALYLGSALGFSLLSCSASLLMLFIGLEMMSLPVYLLVARGTGHRDDPESAAHEAAIKYFFAGGTAGSLFLFGLALFYAETHGFAMVGAPGPLAQAGIALMGAAALFKVGAVPLHFWLPDAYEASSPELAGFLSTSIKASGLLLLIRIVSLAPSSAFARAIPVFAALTMLYGALLAWRQQRLQRLLAYSSIAHAGYLLLGVGAWAAQGALPGAAAPILYYIGAYAFMSNGAFVFLKVSGLETREELKGYASREPALAALFAVVLLSLAGVPPTAGFLAKLLIFWEAIKAGLYLPVACGGLAALAALGYYLGLLRAMYLDEGTAAAGSVAPLSERLTLAACAIPVAVLGLAPWIVAGLAGVLTP